MNEKWKNIKGSQYHVSDRGRVWSDKSGKMLKLTKATHGYPQVHIRYDNGDKRFWRVHRLVAISFIRNPRNKEYVNHINGKKDDNRSLNLEWVTPRENVVHASRNGFMTGPRGEKHAKAILTEKQVLEIRKKHKKQPIKQIAEMYGVGYHVIWYIVNRKTWRHLK